MSKMDKDKAAKLVAQFEDAVLNRYELGSVPVYSGDREEQIAIDGERFRIKRAYARTRNRLLKELST